METRKEIYCNIYGGWEKAKVQNEKRVYCSHSDECSLYQKGMCAGLPGIFKSDCPYSRIETYPGYSQRAMKYTDWAKSIKERDTFNALKPTTGYYIATVGTKMMSTMYCGIYYDEEYKRWKGPNLFGGLTTVLEWEEVTSELLYQLYKYAPFSIFDSAPVKGWQDHRKVWFNVLAHTYPEKYKQFLADYPDVDLSYSHIGMRAKIGELRDGAVFKSGNNTWTITGDKVVCDDYHGGLYAFYGAAPSTRYELTCNLADIAEIPITITSDDQVDEETTYL